MQIDGSPFQVRNTSHRVNHTTSDTPLYYRVTPAGLRASNTIMVEEENNVGFEQPTVSSAHKKIIQNGELLIIHNQCTYDVLGRKK